jgi:hypothetical protein
LGADNYNGGHEESFVKPSLPEKSSEIRRQQGCTALSRSPLRSVMDYPLVHDNRGRCAGIEGSS